MKKLDFDIMLKAYRNGDINLDKFPDSIEKQTLLQTIDKWKSEMSIRKLSSSEISDLKMKLNSSNEVEKTRIILDVLDTCDTSNDELKEMIER
jgi:EAL domain-containing protein (putative c-di-GMP-specific phosphodiesterase class I)